MIAKAAKPFHCIHITDILQKTYCIAQNQLRLAFEYRVRRLVLKLKNDWSLIA